MADGKLQEIVWQWFEKANHDIIAVQRELTNEAPLTDIACFHCQQAAEKYLKAFLAAHLIKPPRIHDIATILKACSELDASFEQLEKVSYLTDFAVEMRYPDAFYMPVIDDARKAYEDAISVKNFVASRLGFRLED